MKNKKLTQDDVKYIRHAAQLVEELSSKHYGSSGLEKHRTVAKLAKKSAKKIERRLSV